MIKLKNKIKIVEPLPPKEKKQTSSLTILFTILFIIIFGFLIFIIYKNFLPYINAIDIEKIIGKKTYITDCNTKDYIIIGNDKSYSLSLTDENCESKHYEGNIIIKNNQIIFNKNITGTIDDNYNIIINNNLFESDNYE